MGDDILPMHQTPAAAAPFLSAEYFMTRECIYVIDTFSLMFQVFHAIPPMTGTRGQPTNAVFGLTRDLFAIRDRGPTHLICALDSPGPGERSRIYPEYKANRTEIPEDLAPQIPLIEQLLQGFRIPGIRKDGWEADDVIATVTRMATERDMDVVIVSSDKDNRQLLGPQVRMLNCRKNEFYDAASLQQDWGIRPDQVVDFQSLVGDKVDNVPGVPKIGPKTAATLIETFGDLENILAHASEAPGKKVQENLQEYADLARVSRELVLLRQDLDLAFDLESARLCEPDHEQLLALFTDLGFRRYASMMREAGAGAMTVGESVGESAAASSAKTQPDWTSLQEVSSSEAERQIGLLQSQDRLFVYPILSGEGVRGRRVQAIACGTSESAWLWSLSESSAQQQALLTAFAEATAEFVVADAKPFCHALLNHGVSLPQRLFDLSVVDYLLESGARGHQLNDIAARLGMSTTDHDAGRQQQQRRTQKTMFADEDEAPQQGGVSQQAALQELQQLAAVDVELRRDLQNSELNTLYEQLEEPLIRVLAEMEHKGIRLESAELQRQSAEMTDIIDRLTEEIHESAGRNFNIDSPKQLSEILFNDLQLPVIRRTQTGSSTDQETLEKLSEQHPLPRMVLERRHLIKLRSTYLDALPSLVHEQTGRIHATFHQTVAATGRLSSSDPNLQNIPIRTPEGKRVRAAFLPESTEWTLLCADYSQIELRMLAHFSGDPALCAAFAAGLDIHAAVAAEVFEIETTAVTSEQRRIAKAVNFGVIYGQSPWGLAAALGIDTAQAAAFIENYFARYAGVEAFCTAVLEETAETGFARTIMNRRRAISGIRNTTGLNRNMAERTAINTVLQGTAADLIKQAMLNVDVLLRESGRQARLLMQIHDELVFECPHDELAWLAPAVRDCMESAMSLKVPLEVAVSAGPNWLQQEDVSC